jgi:hypothetical protein
MMEGGGVAHDDSPPSLAGTGAAYDGGGFQAVEDIQKELVGQQRFPCVRKLHVAEFWIDQNRRR